MLPAVRLAHGKAEAIVEPSSCWRSRPSAHAHVVTLVIVAVAATAFTITSGFEANFLATKPNPKLLKFALQRAVPLQRTNPHHAVHPFPATVVAEGTPANGEAATARSQSTTIFSCFLVLLVAPTAATVWRTLRPCSTPTAEAIALASTSSRRFRRGRVESPQEADARRLQESKEVEERLVRISSFEQLQSALRASPDPKHLFVAEVIDANKCESGIEEEAEVQWKRSQAEVMAPVLIFKHTFQRTARKCTDVTFFHIVRDDTPEMQALLQRLEVTVFPTLLFIKEGRVVWRHNGLSGAEQDLDDGMAWFGNQSTDGASFSDLVQELDNVADLEEFCHPKGSPDLLRVVVAMTSTANACIRVYPAIPAVAKHMKGRATFARVLVDSKEGKECCRKLDVVYVPLMVIFDAQTGEEVARHVVSSRGDFMGLFLQSLERKEAELQEKLDPNPPLLDLDAAPSPQEKKAEGAFPLGLLQGAEGGA